jgi:hypothetical protein
VRPRKTFTDYAAMGLLTVSCTALGVFVVLALIATYGVVFGS